MSKKLNTGASQVLETNINLSITSARSTQRTGKAFPTSEMVYSLPQRLGGLKQINLLTLSLGVQSITDLQEPECCCDHCPFCLGCLNSATRLLHCGGQLVPPTSYSCHLATPQPKPVMTDQMHTPPEKDSHSNIRVGRKPGLSSGYVIYGEVPLILFPVCTQIMVTAYSGTSSGGSEELYLLSRVYGNPLLRGSGRSLLFSADKYFIRFPLLFPEWYFLVF